MNTANSIFKFVTIRNATNKAESETKFEIQPKTELTDSIVTILSDKRKQAEKINTINNVINDFIKSSKFYKSKNEFIDALSKASGHKLEKKNDEMIGNMMLTIYDNIVVRTITKSNTNEVFKSLIDNIKLLYQKQNSKSIKESDIQKLKIVLPEGLIFSFSSATAETIPEIDDTKERTEVLNKISALLKQKEQIIKSQVENSALLKVERQKIINTQNELVKSQFSNVEATPSKTSRVSVPKASTQMAAVSMVELDKLTNRQMALDETEVNINLQLSDLNSKAFQFLPEKRYAYIGEKYVDIAAFIPKPPIIENDSISVYSNGCYLKFPFQIADLRVVEQKTVGYLPNEIAHINNTQSGEKQEKITRRLKRIETYDSLITEDEVTRETDTQSTEKFSLEKTASDIQSEENSANINAGVSGTYGVVTASVDAGFSHAESSTNSNSTAQNYAKEIVQKVIDRVSHKVKSERSIKSIEEFEETVTHLIDNSGTNDKGPKSYVYRWLSKLVKATLKNYGKRLIFQIDVAHPSHYYLTRIIAEKPVLKIPPDPRALNKLSADPQITTFYLKNPTFPTFEAKNITRENYLSFAELYKLKLETPPQKEIILNFQKSATDGAKTESGELAITKGYQAKTAYIREFFRKTGQDHLTVLIGRNGTVYWSSNISTLKVLDLNNETINLPITVLQYASGYHINIEVTCTITDEAFLEWQTKCYFAIIDAYENLKGEAEAQMSSFNPNNPGLNPDKKSELIKTELKKGALVKMFRCNPFWISDDYNVGTEYNANCCTDNLNAEKIRFLESTFDWKNMTYELHPYFYADKKNWSDLLNLSDDDPHFEAFLQSSYATVRIPVFRDSEKEVAAVNFILNNTIANHSVIPHDLQDILNDLKNNTSFEFIDETKTEIPFISIKKEYDKDGTPVIYYLDDDGNKVICKEVPQFDIEGNKTMFYYEMDSGNMVISEIKQGVDPDGKQYNYYFNKNDEKIITHRTKTYYNIDGGQEVYYTTDLGIFTVPTDLVILEAGVQDGVYIKGYPEDKNEPGSDIIIPKQFSPSIIQNNEL